ncbi:MAG: DUF1834 family protein [Deltaproteobacteria bacterium]|nr:DUF1834 family protein [Deltaproteobacteria bacterium]
MVSDGDAMTSLAIKDLEDALLGALEAGLGRTLKTLKSFRGNWREELRQGGLRLPAVLVMLTGSRAEQVGVSSCDLVVDFSLLAMVRQWRGEEAGRREEGGVYDLLTGIREALWHRDLGLNILPLALVREEPLLHTREFCVHAAHYRTVLVQDLAG